MDGAGDSRPSQEDHSGAGEFIRTQNEPDPGSGLPDTPSARTLLLAIADFLNRPGQTRHFSHPVASAKFATRVNFLASGRGPSL